jgi:hypothetical protein
MPRKLNCSVKKCKVKRVTGGYCKSHYNAWYKYGYPDEATKRRELRNKDKPYCSSCVGTKNLFVCGQTTLKSGKSRIRYMCRPCNTKRSRIYRQTENGKRATRRSINKYISANPDRVKAWKAAQDNIELEPCVMCGSLPTHRHHPDIKRPLYVVSLCPLHHKEAHRNISISMV